MEDIPKNLRELFLFLDDIMNTFRVFYFNTSKGDMYFTAKEMPNPFSPAELADIVIYEMTEGFLLSSNHTSEKRFYPKSTIMNMKEKAKTIVFGLPQ